MGTGSLLRKVSGIRKAVAVVLVAALSPLLLNCYGTFPLTRILYKANGSVQNKLVQTVVFWIFIIFPVYSIAMLADTIVLNVVEFWFGATVAVGTVTDPNGNTFALEPSKDGREAQLTISREGKTTCQMRFVKVSDSVCELRDSAGNLAGKAIQTSAGGIQLTDAKGTVVTELSADQIAELRASRHEVALSVAQ